MSALPPFVISRNAEGRKLYLGPTGWTPFRAGALSFESEPQARSWMLEAIPKVRDAIADAQPVDTDEQRHAHGMMPDPPVPSVSDYDPHEVA